MYNISEERKQSIVQIKVSAVQSHRGLGLFPPDTLHEALTVQQRKKEGKMIYHWCVRVDIPEKLKPVPQGTAALPKDVIPAQIIHLDGSLNVPVIKSSAKFSEWRQDIVTTAVNDIRTIYQEEVQPNQVTVLSFSQLSGGLK
jgi:hypothetical protein